MVVLQNPAKWLAVKLSLNPFEDATEPQRLSQAKWLDEIADTYTSRLEENIDGLDTDAKKGVMRSFCAGFLTKEFHYHIHIESENWTYPRRLPLKIPISLAFRSLPELRAVGLAVGRWRRAVHERTIGNHEVGVSTRSC